MRTTAFLTLTGTGTVIQEWLNQLAAGTTAAPELPFLGAALVGLGLLTLLSHREHGASRPSTEAAPTAPSAAALPATSQHA